MGTLIDFHPTTKSMLREARREIDRMYRLSAGGQDPIPSNESRELFELGWLEEVEWLDWESYCLSIINEIYEGQYHWGGLKSVLD